MVCGGGGGLRDPRAALLQLPARHEPRHAADGRRHPRHLPPRSSGRETNIIVYKADLEIMMLFIS